MKAALKAYINDLEVSQGQLAGKRFQLLGWQNRFIANAFKPNNVESALSIARGAGKTTFIAAIGLAHLEADGVKQKGAEITIVCSTIPQGAILFDHVLRFLGPRVANYTKQHSQQAMSLKPKGLDTTTLRVVGSNPGALHGAAPSLVIADEVAQWPKNKVNRMLAALRTGLGKIPNSRMLLLGTRAETNDSAFEEAIRLADFSMIYSARQSDPIFRQSTWYKANPTLRSNGFNDLLALYRKDAQKAKLSPQFLQAFKALRLNMGVPDTLQAYVLEIDDYKRCITNDVKIENPYILGIDLGSTGAMSAIAAYGVENGALEVVAAFPNFPKLVDRELADGVQGLYRRMEARGELFTADGHVVQVTTLLETAIAKWGVPMSIVVDRWRLGELVDALNAISFPSAQLITRGQGFKDGAEDVHLFRKLVLSDMVHVGESVLLTSAIAEARVVSDPAGNQKLSKKSEGGRRSRGKDDALAAAILAVAEGARMQGSGNQSMLYYGQVS